MYLTKIRMPLSNRAVQRALGDCQQMHRLVTGFFGTSRKDLNILYRLRYERGTCSIYIYSSEAVDRGRVSPGMEVAGEREMSDWLSSIREGQTWNFDLMAWPSKKVAREGANNSRRRMLRSTDERLLWLQRKAQQNGFDLLGVRELESAQQTGWHDAGVGGQFHVHGYHYQGTLRVTDAERIQAAVCTGIGPGKAYGLGMLILTR